MKIFDSTMSIVQRAMDLNFRRHAILSSNIANSETPNFRARDIDFAGELTRASKESTGDVAKTNPLHMDLTGDEQSHIVNDDSGATGADGNNVDLDISVGKMSQASMAYSNAASLMSFKLRMLRTIAVRSGGG